VYSMDRVMPIEELEVVEWLPLATVPEPLELAETCAYWHQHESIHDGCEC